MRSVSKTRSSLASSSCPETWGASRTTSRSTLGGTPEKDGGTAEDQNPEALFFGQIQSTCVGRAASVEEGSEAVKVASPGNGEAADASQIAGGGVADERIPLRIKLAFCAPTVGMLPFVAMFSLYGNTAYEAFGAALPRIALYTALARSFDVISDPLMSHLTDGARTRFGRRRPFMLIGAVPYATLMLLLMKPPYGDTMTISTWFGTMYILYFLCNTFVGTPFFALAPDLSTDPDQRTSLFFLMSVFEAVATLLAMMGPMAATLQVKARKWNAWTCKSFPEQASLCFDAHTCGDVVVEGRGSSFRPNGTLASLLAPLHALFGDGVNASAPEPTLPTTASHCAEWLRDGVVKVLGNASTSPQNDAFCECMSTCDAACDVADRRTGFEWVAWAFAIWFLVSMIILVIIVRERPVPEDGPAPPLVPAMFNTMYNAPFRILLPAWACDAFCNAIVQSMTPYFVIIVTAPPFQAECADPEARDYSSWHCETPNVIAACGIAVLLAAIVGLPVWHVLVKRFGKVETWWLWSLTMAGTNLLFVFLGSGWVTPLWIVAALNGLPLGAKFIADSILGDIIDYDEFLTGHRSEATYFMFRSFLPKIVQIPASAMPIALMGAMGYVPPVAGVEQRQPDAVILYVKAVVFSCFAVSLCAFFLKRRYPLSMPAHLEEVRRGIEAHRRGETYPDPVTSVEYRLMEVTDELQGVYWMLDHFRASGIRKAFVHPSVDPHEASEPAEVESAIDLGAGTRSLVWRMSLQVAATVIGLVISASFMSFGMGLLENATWNFIPTVGSVAVGVSVVSFVLACFRLRAALQLKACAERGELTPHCVSQVLLRRDLLGKVGLSNKNNGNKFGSEASKGSADLRDTE